MNIGHVALLEENVGFVEQKDSTPGMANVQRLLQLSLKIATVGPQVTGRDAV